MIRLTLKVTNHLNVACVECGFSTSESCETFPWYDICSKK